MRFLFIVALCAAPLLGAGESPEIGEAFDRLYNFNFPVAHKVLDQYISTHPTEPLSYAVRAAADLFFELDRLGILEEEFFVSDDRIAEKKKLKPDPAKTTRGTI